METYGDYQLINIKGMMKLENTIWQPPSNKGFRQGSWDAKTSKSLTRGYFPALKVSPHKILWGKVTLQWKNLADTTNQIIRLLPPVMEQTDTKCLPKRTNITSFVFLSKMHNMNSITMKHQTNLNSKKINGLYFSKRSRSWNTKLDWGIVPDYRKLEKCVS